jgi:hypothetical protein
VTEDGKRRRLAVRAVVVIVAVEVVGFGEFVPYFWFMNVVRLLLAIIALLIALLVIRPIDQKRVKESHRHFKVHPVGREQGQELLQLAGRTKIITARQSLIFALSITAPAELRKRVVDNYRLDERTIRQRVTLEGQIPRRYHQNHQDDEPKVVYLPALAPPKGKLLDDWRITDAGGTEIPGLTYRESLLVIASVLRILLVSACRGQENLRDGMTEAAIQAEEDAIQVLIARDTANSDLLESENIDKVVARIEKLPGPVDENEQNPSDLARSVRNSRAMAATFVRKLSRNYVIITPIVPNGDDRFIFSYEQTLIPDLEVHPARSKWVEALIGSPTVAVGARPVDITIGINNASTCQSYHLFVDGSEGVWLGEQECIDMGKTLKLGARGAPTLPHPRFRGRLGQSYGHFYVRYFPEPKNVERPRIRFQFFEVPPGSLLRAGVAAIASFLLVWVIAAVTTMRPDAGSPGSDAPAILLAFPAIAAAWIGLERKERRLLEGTLAARGCLMITVAVSIAAAALFMAHSVLAVHHFNWWRLPLNSSILWVKDTLWAILVVIALANAVTVTYKYVVKTWEYWHLASRAQVNSEATRRS